MKKEDYYLRKSKGICVRCGHKQAETGKTMCADCLEVSRKNTAERREWLLGLGYCPVCGREKLEGNEKRCPECLAKIYVANKKYISKRPDITHRNYIARKTVLDEKGLCRQCGKREKAVGKTYCETCLAKKRDQKKIAYEKGNIPRSERFGYGLCYRCGQPLDTDKRLCKACCEKTALNFKKSNVDRINHPWKKDNQLLSRKVAAI